jgi:UDP-glucose 4-epimerase
MAEEVIRDFDRAHGIHSICLRYFNVVGVSSLGCIGEKHNSETRLIPNILNSMIMKKMNPFSICGIDYPTRDGTCIRDYISVEDLIDAHIKALAFLLQINHSDIFNIGTEMGHTVKKILTICECVTQRKIPFIIKDRRKGDPVQQVASYQKAKTILNWQPQQSLEEAIRSAYNWARSKNGYLP